MMKKGLLIAIGALFGFALLAGCNRPIPRDYSTIHRTPIPSSEALLLTRTVLAFQIERTLTSIAATAAYPVPQTEEISIQQQTAIAQITVEVNDNATLPLFVATVDTSEPTGDVTKTKALELTPTPTGKVSLASPMPTEFAPVITLTQASTPIEATATVESTQPATPEPEPLFTAESPKPAATTRGGMVTPTVGELGLSKLEIPEVYILHQGEFPWCLGRRFDIDPRQIMGLNGFFPWQTFRAGQPVVLPQNPFPFPGPRALYPHPACYQVGVGETIYSIACFFGDVDPLQLAAANGLKPPYRLYVGQTLNIP